VDKKPKMDEIKKSDEFKRFLEVTAERAQLTSRRSALSKEYKELSDRVKGWMVEKSISSIPITDSDAPGETGELSLSMRRSRERLTKESLERLLKCYWESAHPDRDQTFFEEAAAAQADAVWVNREVTESMNLVRKKNKRGSAQKDESEEEEEEEEVEEPVVRQRSKRLRVVHPAEV
jgi:hypothetical protein